MRAVVLVGGTGTRLRPLTLTTPKQMLPVAEMTMIERVLAHLAGHGIEEVVLSMGYRPDAFLAAFPEGACAGVQLQYALDPTPLDTAGAIRFAAHHGGLDDTFVVVNGDVLTDLDVTALVAYHREQGAAATISTTTVDDPSSFGVVATDADGHVRAFVEKPAPGQEPSNQVNAGAYVFEPSVLALIPPDRRVSIERETFPALVEAGTLFAQASSAYWTDTGTPALYLRANLDLVAGLRPGPPGPGAKEREPGVWTLGAAVVDGVVDRPALIGDAAFIGAGAHVSGSVVGAGARVESGAVVAGSLLLPGAVVRPGAVVEGSIVGEVAVVGTDAKVVGLSVVQGGAVVADGADLDGALVTA